MAQRGRTRWWLGVFNFYCLYKAIFNLLVILVSISIDNHPISDRFGKPKKWHILRRLFGIRDIVAMVIKSMTAVAESKDVYVQFGATAACFHDYVVMRPKCIIHVLSDDYRANVCWDRSIESLDKAAQRATAFLDIPNVVGMLDGMKRCTLAPDESKLQNWVYNSWAGNVSRSVVLLWDPFS